MNKLITSLVLPMIISGCAIIDSNKIAPGYKEAFSTIKNLYFQDNNLKITSDVIEKIPFASALLKIGRGSQGLIILESINGYEETWVSADGLFIVLNKGRIVKTAGIEHNLIAFNTNLNITTVDETIKYYQYYSYDNPPLNNLKVEVEINNKGMVKTKLFDKEKELFLTEETITSQYHGWSFTNKFWFDENGFVWKTRQKISPKLPFFEIEITKKPAN